MSYRQQLTDLGRDIIAESQTGMVLRFTRMVLGEGETPIENVPHMTELVAPVMETGIASVVHRRIGQVTITSKIQTGSVPRPFELNEIGIFASVDGGDEVLYTVSIAEEHAEWLSPFMTGSSTNERTIAIAVVIGATLEVDAIFDPDISMVNIGPPSIGAGFYSRRTGNTFEFKRAIGSGWIQITEDTEAVRFNMRSPIPSGTMAPFAGGSAPIDWLLCDGAEVSRIEFPLLFGSIGTTYGAGDGSATFNLPDSRGRTLIGAGGGVGLSQRVLGTRAGEEAHTLTVAELAWHDHSWYDPGHIHGDHGHVHGVSDWGHVHNTETLHWQNPATVHPNSQAPIANYWIREHVAISSTNLTGVQIQVGHANIAAATTNIQFAASGGNGAHNNMQPFLVVNYIIKT